ncbi:MAG: Foldase protein PrsA 1 precursor [Firmicutes bacterium ADurb.Bin153]|nr:MAG: Foldase protein PrsA 1 precursor [Firmicutes bacterium ADurb.Bin153]
MDNRVKKSYILLASVVAVVVIAASAWVIFSRKTAVAMVNGERITRKAFLDKLESQAGAQILQEMINETLLAQEAKKAGVSITQERVDEELAKVKTNLGDQYEYVLSMYGMTEDSLRMTLQQNLLAYEISTKDIVVTEDQIAADYKANPDYYLEPAQVRASHILVRTKEEAQEVLNELKKGADFVELAKAKSIDTGTAANGGDLGFFGSGAMTEAFETAAFKLNVGQLSPIVETEYGFHVILCTDKKAEKMPTLEEAHDLVVEKIKGEQAKNIDTLLLEVKDKSTVTVTDSKYESLNVTHE